LVNFGAVESTLRCIAVLFCGKRFAIISMKPYKIRNITMKNFIETALKNSQKNSVKSQILKWASQGGGGSMHGRVKK
jgi:hypothetical protein